MKKSHFGFACAAVCVFAAAAFSQKISAGSDVVPGRYIVVLNEKYAASNLLADETALLVNDLASDYGASVDKTYSSALKGFSAQMSQSAVSAISTDPRVRYIEPDRMMSVSSSQTNAPWNLDRVDQRSLPWNGMYDYAGTGLGVHVYIIDTGIRVTHVEFGSRASVSFDAVSDGQNGLDCNGHGTHVAGIVGGATWGVAKGAYLHAVRVLGCTGTGLLSNVLAGVDWVTANHEIHRFVCGFRRYRYLYYGWQPGPFTRRLCGDRRGSIKRC